VKRKRVLPWLAIAALFALAAWLFSLGDAPPASLAHPVTYPHPPPPEPTGPAVRAGPSIQANMPPKAPVKRDPLLVALPNGASRSAMVLEANALRNSPIGELLVDCLKLSDAGVLEKIRTQFGIDPLQDLDRLAFNQEGVVITGQFAGLHWSDLFDGETPTSYGDQGSLYDVVDDGGVSMVATRWGDQLFGFSSGEASARAMVDRLEGRGAAEAPILSDQQTYGDAYGVMGASMVSELLEKLLPPDQSALRTRLESAASSIEFHLDASHDLALTAEVQGNDPGALSDLAHSLGAAFAVWRMYAQANGQPELAALLDQADVKPGDGRFEVHLALPLSVLQARFADCRNWKWGSGAGK
jgi:hypothetical protein